MKKCKRKKSFFGALIGAAASIGTSIYNANKQAEVAAEQMRFQKEQAEKQEQLRKDAAEQTYYNQLNSNSDIYNSLRESLSTAKFGGKFKKCKKNKAEFGTIYNSMMSNNNFDTSRFLGDIFQSIGTAASGMISAKSSYDIANKKLETDKYVADLQNNKETYQMPNFNNVRNSIVDRTQNNNIDDTKMEIELQKRRNKYAKSLYLS